MQPIHRIDTTMASSLPRTPEHSGRWGSSTSVANITPETMTIPELDNSLGSPLTPHSPVSPTSPLREPWARISRQSSLRKQPACTKNGQLTLGRQIGSGSFSRIYEGYGPQGLFAVKTRLSSTSEELFAHERVILTKLVHATSIAGGASFHNIVQFYPELSDSDHFVLRMYDTNLDALVRSSACRELSTEPEDFDFVDYRVASRPIVGLEQWMNWAPQLIRGLRFMHAQNIVHADIKPDNILVNRASDEIVLSDFSGAVDLEANHTSVLAKELVEGFAWSPVFTDPEVRAGARSPSFGSDIYGLGLVLAFCATGQEPFASAKNATQRLLWMEKVSPLDSYELDTQQHLKAVRPVIELMLKRSWDGVDATLDALEAN